MSHSLSVTFFTFKEHMNKRKHINRTQWGRQKQRGLARELGEMTPPLPNLHPSVLRHSAPWRQNFFLSPLPGMDNNSFFVGEFWLASLTRKKTCHTHCCLMLSHVHIMFSGFPPIMFRCKGPLMLLCWRVTYPAKGRHRAISEDLSCFQHTWASWLQGFPEFNRHWEVFELSLAFTDSHQLNACYLQCENHSLIQHFEATFFLLLFQLPSFHWNFGSTNCSIWPWMRQSRWGITSRYMKGCIGSGPFHLHHWRHQATCVLGHPRGKNWWQKQVNVLEVALGVQKWMIFWSLNIHPGEVIDQFSCIIMRTRMNYKDSDHSYMQ